MCDTKTYVFPENGIGSGDSGALLAAMNNSGFGGNGNWLWVIFLFFLYGWGGNGMFGRNGMNGVAGEINGDYGRDLLMQAINGNRTALSELSTRMSCDTNAIQTAISGVMNSVQSVGNSVGLSAQQTINAIQSGNASLASQLANCCCENRLAICQQTNALTSRIDQLANGIQTGFSSTAYETAQQTCSLQNTIKDSGVANTNAILAKLDQMENAAMADKIAALTEKNSTLTTQLNLEHQNQTFAAMLAPIQSEVAAIKAAQPQTVAVPYPQLTAVPSSYIYGYGGNGWA